MEKETDVLEAKLMLQSWLENGARDHGTIHGYRNANMISNEIFKQAKKELGVISFCCPIKEEWIYALPDVRRCDGCGSE